MWIAVRRPQEIPNISNTGTRVGGRLEDKHVDVFSKGHANSKKRDLPCGCINFNLILNFYWAIISQPGIFHNPTPLDSLVGPYPLTIGPN